MHIIINELLSVTSNSVINIHIHRVLFIFLILSLEVIASEVIVLKPLIYKMKIASSLFPERVYLALKEVRGGHILYIRDTLQYCCPDAWYGIKLLGS